MKTTEELKNLIATENSKEFNFARQTANYSELYIIGEELNGLDLSGFNFTNVTFSQKIKEFNFDGCNFTNTCFCNCDLENGSFVDCNFKNLSMTQTTLEDITFTNCNVKEIIESKNSFYGVVKVDDTYMILSLLE